jgi:hypothetical protein
MNSLDKAIWDSAYDEEYDGFVSLPTWEVVSEADFKQLSKGKRALPTMAIATIKYDAFNKPKRQNTGLLFLGTSIKIPGPKWTLQHQSCHN